MKKALRTAYNLITHLHRHKLKAWSCKLTDNILLASVHIKTVIWVHLDASYMRQANSRDILVLSTTRKVAGFSLLKKQLAGFEVVKERVESKR